MILFHHESKGSPSTGQAGMKQMLKLLSQLSNVENRCYNEDLVLASTNRFWLSDLVKNVSWGVQAAHFDTPIWLLSVLQPCELRINTAVFRDRTRSTETLFSKSRAASFILVSVSLSVSTITETKKKKYKKFTDFIYKYVKAQQINDNNTLHLGSLSITLLWSQQHNGKPLT